MLTFLRKKFVMHADQSFCTFTFTLNLQLQSRQDNHRPRGDTPRMAQRLASFARSTCTGDTREHAPTALTALPEEVRGGSDLRRRSACALARLSLGVCVWAHTAMLTCRCMCIRGIRARARSTWGARLGGVQPVEHAVWRGTGPERRRAIDHRGVRSECASRVALRRDESDRPRSGRLDIVLSFLAAHPQSTPHIS